MFQINRRNSTINAGFPRRAEPILMVVRSRCLREFGSRLVHNMCEFQEACPDAHPEDAESVSTLWTKQPDATIRLVPGR